MSKQKVVKNNYDKDPFYSEDGIEIIREDHEKNGFKKFKSKKSSYDQLKSISLEMKSYIFFTNDFLHQVIMEEIDLQKKIKSERRKFKEQIKKLENTIYNQSIVIDEQQKDIEKNKEQKEEIKNIDEQIEETINDKILDEKKLEGN